MSNALKDYLLEHETSAGDFTHTSLSPYTRVGKYKIISNDNFYKIYAEQILQKKKPCYLSERHMEKYGKPCIDIDLRYDYEESPERKYNFEVEDNQLIGLHLSFLMSRQNIQKQILQENG